ncbi:uncharacterized protein [Mytilus edulis]|uniref:uncharacterized protein n=1 Tax=Mytilus edulis TaxID=6550 RepID=UPI0039EEE033
MFTSSAAQTPGSKAINSATTAALKGVEKGASKAVDHIIYKVTRPRKHIKTPSQQPSVQHKKPEQVRLNNLISGSGIKTIHDFVQRYKYIMSDIITITEGLTFDESLQEYQVREYEPQAGAQLNNPGAEIRINFETQDLFLHPAESYLVVEGRLLKNDDTAYADGDLVSLAHNGIMYLFKSISYRLSGQQIEHINDPGIATTKLGKLTYPDDFSKSQGLNQLWYKDSPPNAEAANIGFAARHGYIITKPTNKGSFSFAIPLKHIFGFADDYNKIVYGFRHELSLVRDSNSNAILRAAAVNDAAKIVLSKLSWFVPHVTPSDENKMQLYKTFQSKSKIHCGFRMRQCDSIAVPQASQFNWRLAARSGREKPRYIIIAFQTNRSGD